MSKQKLYQCKHPRSWCDHCWGPWPEAAGLGQTWSGATRCLRSDSASPAQTSQRPGPRRCHRSLWCARAARRLSGSPGPPGCSDGTGVADWRRLCPPRHCSLSCQKKRENQVLNEQREAAVYCSYTALSPNPKHQAWDNLKVKKPQLHVEKLLEVFGLAKLHRLKNKNVQSKLFGQTIKNRNFEVLCVLVIHADFLLI